MFRCSEEPSHLEMVQMFLVTGLILVTAHKYVHSHYHHEQTGGGGTVPALQSLTSVDLSYSLYVRSLFYFISDKMMFSGHYCLKGKI